ncbi:hypothetical protein ACMD2_14077 [Ananas comosus]|uniref:Uncharacterized protein n=1 Tax=Ananas comosus TaxID=4615 RepID=A0A199W4U5_ANACO|nr:hypothetical protein ACMD2_14077 [Ananas comosus]
MYCMQLVWFNISKNCRDHNKFGLFLPSAIRIIMLLISYSLLLLLAIIIIYHYWILIERKEENKQIKPDATTLGPICLGKSEEG